MFQSLAFFGADHDGVEAGALLELFVVDEGAFDVAFVSRDDDAFGEQVRRVGAEFSLEDGELVPGRLLVETAHVDDEADGLGLLDVSEELEAEAFVPGGVFDEAGDVCEGDAFVVDEAELAC